MCFKPDAFVMVETSMILILVNGWITTVASKFLSLSQDGSGFYRFSHKRSNALHLLTTTGMLKDSLSVNGCGMDKTLFPLEEEREREDSIAVDYRERICFKS
jgi:hypothetical protein